MRHTLEEADAIDRALNSCKDAQIAHLEAEIARLRAENQHLKAWLETRGKIIECADANQESWRKEAVRLNADKARLVAALEEGREMAKGYIPSPSAWLGKTYDLLKEVS